jgi:lipoprotein NlpD
MGVQASRVVRLCLAATLAALLAACASPARHAPVEDRSASHPAPIVQATPVQPPPGSENAGKPGYYTVKPGDTLIHIALDSGQNWRDIARWNNLDDPNRIEVGQVLRVATPASELAVATPRGVSTPTVEARPLKPAVPASGASAPVVASSAPVQPPAVPSSGASSVGAMVAPLPSPREPGEEIAWQWPANGPVIQRFDEVHSKGIAIAGKAGDPVYAAADGKVVYAGSGLRGYGNLVIIKHNNTYLTAYAHNQALLVKEEQSVKRGQKIAEMGSSDADRVELHFEIRKQGKPVDPLTLLPAR